ncbi:MAG TPA: cytochrome c biogenesis protein CcdA, partial [Oceanithermus sp.]|nr:cytochrome c biogenesis protein CcdA [Oceanithermus sp.]
MEPANLNLVAAFLGGMASFLLPCVLPLVPTYLLYLSGERGRPFVNAVFFVLGFSVVFVLLFGLPTTLLGNWLYSYKETLARVGGVLFILFGLYMLGVRIPVPFLSAGGGAVAGYQGDPSRPLGAFLMGLVLALGWTPCIGPVLTLILALVFNQGGLLGLVYVVAYTLGLAVPFLLVALFTDRAVAFIRRNAR